MRRALAVEDSACGLHEILATRLAPIALHALAGPACSDDVGRVFGRLSLLVVWTVRVGAKLSRFGQVLHRVSLRCRLFEVYPLGLPALKRETTYRTITSDIRLRFVRAGFCGDIFIQSEKAVRKRKNNTGFLTYYVLKEGMKI